MAQLEDIIQYIAYVLQREHINCGVTRLVKLLYLLECWYYQLHRQRLLNVTWKFLHFGPYAFEIEDSLKQLGIVKDAREFDNDKTFRKIAISDNSEDTPVPRTIQSEIETIVRKWGSADLNQLLNYVYFNTAPMREAKKNDILDISKSLDDLKRKGKVQLPLMDKDKIKSMRKRLKKREKINSPKLHFKHEDDKDLQMALKGMEEEESSAPIKGVVYFHPKATYSNAND